MVLFLLFLSFFASTSIPITFYRPTSQGAGCLHTALTPPRLQTPRPPGLDIGTLNIRDGRVCRLAQIIREVERGRLDLVSLMKKIRMEECSNNRRGYDVVRAAGLPSRAGGAQVGVGLGLRDRPNEWGGESTRLHGPNAVSCEIMWKVSCVEVVRGVTTV